MSVLATDTSSTECGLPLDEDSDIDTIKGTLSEDKPESDYHSDSTIEADLNGEDSEDLSLSSSDDSSSSSESSDLENSDGSSHTDSTGSNVREEDSSSGKNKVVQSRTPRSQTGDSEEERAEKAAVANILASKCCADECLLHSSGHLIVTARQRVSSFTRNERRQWIYNKISDSSHMVNGKIKVNYSVGGMNICRAAF